MNTLRNLMRGNAAFSVGSGLLLLGGSRLWSEPVGLPTWFLAASGIALAGYGSILAVLSRSRDVRPGAKFATAMDLGWVLGAAVVLIVFPNALNGAGRLALLLVSLAVAGFAAGQLTALRGLTAAR